MQSPIKGRSCIDIRASYMKNISIVLELLALHSLSGCDTVASCYGIEKMTALKVASKGHTLNLLGCQTAEISEVVKQATAFMAECYGISSCSSMLDCRLSVWAKKTGKASSAPKLCSLPPTTEGFHENILRAHLQVAVWLSCVTGYPLL